MPAQCTAPSTIAIQHTAVCSVTTHTACKRVTAAQLSYNAPQVGCLKLAKYMLIVQLAQMALLPGDLFRIKCIPMSV